MYVTRLDTGGVKRLGYFGLSFQNSDGTPRMWTVLIGENGTAKTTILQAIALAAAGGLHVNEVAGSLVHHLRDRRAPSGNVHIEARFSFGERSRRPGEHPALHERLGSAYATFVESEGFGLLSRVSMRAHDTALLAGSDYTSSPAHTYDAKGPRPPLDDARAASRPGWFVHGIGPTRLPPHPGSMPDLSRPQVARLLPLMDPRRPLVSTSFLAHFGADSPKGRAFMEALERVLIGTGLLPEDIIGLDLGGPGGIAKPVDWIERDRFVQRMGGQDVEVPVAAFANGVQSTIGWVADLVGHALLEAEGDLAPDEMEGLVLLDEIDLYLHPTWQVRLVSALKQTFPRLQFVVTTHSPALLSACAPQEIVRLGFGLDGYVRQIPSDPHEDPRWMTATEIYSDYFRLDDHVTLNPHGERLRAALALASSRDRTPEDERTLDRWITELERDGVDTASVRHQRASTLDPLLDRLRQLAMEPKDSASS